MKNKQMDCRETLNIIKGIANVNDYSYSISSNTFELVKEEFLMRTIDIAKHTKKLENIYKKVANQKLSMQSDFFDPIKLKDTELDNKLIQEQHNSILEETPTYFLGKGKKSPIVLQEKDNNLLNVVKSPFKSPATPNVVNLRAMNASSSQTNCSPNSLIKNESNLLENVFEDTEELPNRYKRKSSELAELNTKKRIERQLVESKTEEFVKKPLDRLFCEVIKENPMLIKLGITKQCSVNSPLKLGILSDKTNSPIQLSKFNNNKHETIAVNTNFFLPDTMIENRNCNIEPETTDKPVTVSRSYLKRKQKNTKINGKYRTVVIKKKVIIDVFNCPEQYIIQSKKNRKVTFNLNPVELVHNKTSKIDSIFVEPRSISSKPFIWNEDKKVVEVVRRIYLGSETPVEDFIYTKVDKSIEF